MMNELTRSKVYNKLKLHNKEDFFSVIYVTNVVLEINPC